MKMTNIAPLIGMAPTICAGQGVPGWLVHANQKRPQGRTIAPMIMGGRRRSGTIFPGVLAVWRAKVVRALVMVAMRPKTTPMKRGMNAREAWRGVQWRSWTKEMGKPSKKRKSMP